MKNIISPLYFLCLLTATFLTSVTIVSFFIGLLGLIFNLVVYGKVDKGCLRTMALGVLLPWNLTVEFVNG